MRLFMPLQPSNFIETADGVQTPQNSLRCPHGQTSVEPACALWVLLVAGEALDLIAGVLDHLPDRHSAIAVATLF